MSASDEKDEGVADRRKLSDDLTSQGYTRFPVLSIKDFLGNKYPARKRILGRWLIESSRAMVYAPRGTGKTHFVGWLAASVALGEAFLGWKVKAARRVCLLDGEMHPADLQKRFGAIAEKFPALRETNKLQVLSLQLYDGRRPDLATEEGQEVVDACVPKGTELLIIDTLSAWTTTGREDAIAWAGLDAWIKRKNREGMAVLLVHHTGKSQKGQRGTSAREDQLEMVLALRRPRDYRPGEGARFEVWFEKAREMKGKAVEPFEARLRKKKEEPPEWKIGEIRTEDSMLRRVAAMQAKGLSLRKIAKKLGVAASTITRLLQRNK